MRLEAGLVDGDGRGVHEPLDGGGGPGAFQRDLCPQHVGRQASLGVGVAIGDEVHRSQVDDDFCAVVFERLAQSVVVADVALDDVHVVGYWCERSGGPRLRLS